MFGLSAFRLVGIIAGSLAIFGIAWAVQDRFRLAEIVHQAERCEKASTSETASVVDCTPPMRVQVEQARQARQCDRALAQKDRAKALFEIRAVCTANVLVEVAARSAAEGNLADARATIATVTAGQTAAVERAEARALSLSQQRTKADAAVASAPRLANGLARCDADCLRRLAGR
jgi:hypothetical protein